MISRHEILDMFKATSALLDGHFRLTSGKHSRQYFQCAKVLQYPQFTEKLCSSLASNFLNSKITVVVAPAIGGIVVGQEVGRILGVRTIFAERENGEMKLRRGFEIFPNDQILICEDVITTGGSVLEVYELVKNQGKVIGIGSIVDRSNGESSFPVPYHSLLALSVESFESETCPMCVAGEPIIKPGSRPVIL